MDPEVREHLGDALVHDDEVSFYDFIKKARPFYYIFSFDFFYNNETTCLL